MRHALLTFGFCGTKYFGLQTQGGEGDPERYTFRWWHNGVEDTGETIDDVQGPSPEAFADLQIQALADEIQIFSVSADLPIEIAGERGTLLSLAPHQLRTSSGEMVSGTVEIELIEAFDRGTMLAIDMPSQGRNDMGEIAQLISGGEHYVNATQNGEDLELDRLCYVCFN